MSFPVESVLVALALNCAILCAIYLIAWKTQGEKPHALTWAVAFLAATGQWSSSLFSNDFSSFESYWLTVNALGMVVITLGLRGHCQRTNFQGRPQNLWPYSALVYAGILWFTIVEQHVGLRTAMLPFAAAMTLFLSAFMVIRHREYTRPAEYAGAIAMALFGLSLLGAAYAAVLQGATGHDAYRALFVKIITLSLPAGYTGVAMFVVFILASDLAEEMKKIAACDQLTGLLNRRGFGEQTAQAFATCRRIDRPASVIMTDIDHFKNINDEFGHSVGDSALCHFAEILRGERRGEDILARMGGEEFALVLPGSELEECIRVAEALCLRLEDTPMDIGGKELTMTASFGVATLSAKDTCLTDVVVRADRALYRSKRGGRNRVDLESSQLVRCADGTLKPIST